MKIISRKKAKELGLTYYFTGKSCKHGHICEKFTSNGSCLLCSNTQRNSWRQKNPDKFKESQKKSGKKHRESNKEEYQNHLLSPLPFSTIKEAYDNNYHLDHIVPLWFIAANIKSKKLSFKIAMSLVNIRLITDNENLQKSKRIDLFIVQETIKLLNKKYNVNMPLF